MAKMFRPRRGTTEKNAALVGGVGELTVDTTKSTVRVHDGTTAGGTELARTKDIPTKVSQLTNDSGYAKSSAVLPLDPGSIEMRPGSSAGHGGFIDFHYNNSTADYTSRIIEYSSGQLTITAQNGLLLNGTAVLTSHQSLANCYKVTGGALNSGAQISRVTNGTSWINGRNAALVRQTSAPGDSWGPIGSCKVTSGSWEFGCLQNNFYFVYSSDTNFNAGTNSTTNVLTLTTGGVSVAGALKGTTVQATSDGRLKEGFSNPTYDLSSLKAYRYRFKGQSVYHVGLIAQEVEKVIPEAVAEGEDGYLALDYNAVVAALVNAVNSLQAQINQLKEAKNG